MPAFTDAFARLRSRYVPDHLVGDVLSKPWIDNAIPFLALVVIVAVFGSITPDFFALSNLSDLGRQIAEFGLVTLGLTIVVISGGIDLSVGQVFSLAALFTLLCINVWNWPVLPAAAAVLAAGALAGAINGVLVGYLRLRAFLTTLVTLIIFRSLYELVFVHFETALVSGTGDSPLWDFLGAGSILGIPASLILALVIAAAWHVVLSRMRPGWRLTAVGGARRSAYNAGINVRSTVFFVYVSSGVLAALAGFLFAARLGSVGSDTGIGMEVSALTAVVLGGNSLGGGRGSVIKAMMGALFVLILNNSLINFGVTGPLTSLLFGCVLIAAVFIDMRWQKGREKWLAQAHVSPAFVIMPPPVAGVFLESSPFAPNDRLAAVEAIGLGEVEGPGDVILDQGDNLYCGTRQGEVLRFRAPDYGRHEVFAHVGGHPLGMTFDARGNLLVCVAGMGVHAISPAGVVTKLADETNRSLFSVSDDSRLRLANDLDIAPDGRIFFTDASTRYDQDDWTTDALESRGNGRLISLEPGRGKARTILHGLVFPSGVAIASDGQSLLFSEGWSCTVSRFWFDGPRKGRVETVLPDLPGYPARINRAADGSYWVAIMGMRNAAFDLALAMPGFRRRMARRVAPDMWLCPNINIGCVARFTEGGEVIETLWDVEGSNHTMITSAREHKGFLYLGGIASNRIGRVPVAGSEMPHRPWAAGQRVQA
jgi:ribose transport system permease protein